MGRGSKDRFRVRTRLEFCFHTKCQCGLSKSLLISGLCLHWQVRAVDTMISKDPAALASEILYSTMEGGFQNVHKKTTTQENKTQTPPEVQVSHCPLLDLSSAHMHEVINPQPLMDLLKYDSPVPSPSQFRKPGLRFSNRRIRRQPRKGERKRGAKGLGVDMGEELHSGELYSFIFIKFPQYNKHY